MRKTYFLAAILLFGLLAGSVVSAQKAGKPWTEWSEREARKLLFDSAWGKTQDGGAEISRYLTPPTAYDNRTVDNTAAISQLAAKLNVRFLSALPIRQAFARMMEINQKKPDPVLHDQLQNFIDRKFDDWIVISVDYEVKEGWDSGALRQALANSSTETLKHYTYLETNDGQYLPLQEYKAPIQDGLGAKFIFPRLVNGQPFITANTKNVLFHSEIGRFLRINVHFKVSEMMVNGNLEY